MPDPINSSSSKFVTAVKHQLIKVERTLHRFRGWVITTFEPRDTQTPKPSAHTSMPKRTGLRHFFSKKVDPVTHHRRAQQEPISEMAYPQAMQYSPTTKEGIEQTIARLKTLKEDREQHPEKSAPHTVLHLEKRIERLQQRLRDLLERERLKERFQQQLQALSQSHSTDTVRNQLTQQLNETDAKEKRFDFLLHSKMDNLNCAITSTPAAALKEIAFPTSYHGKLCTSRSDQEVNHVPALYRSTFTTKSEHQSAVEKGEHQPLTVIRHGTCSAYRVKDPAKRQEAAKNRVNELIIMALHANPEKYQQAINGETVDLFLTSTSLLTPDLFRHRMFKQKGDEVMMMEEQMAAFHELSQAQQPVTIQLKKRAVSLNLTALTFNFGVNQFALSGAMAWMTGWDRSDVYNDSAIEQLVGSNEESNSLVSEWLQNHPSHFEAEFVRGLAQQIREIYQTRAHRTNTGGAYKLSARVTWLTSLLGGTPLNNCKSAKDRTSMNIAVTQALKAYSEMKKKLPDWRHIDEDMSQLIKDMLFSGESSYIQQENCGVPGSKVDSTVLKEYGMTPDDITVIKGLSFLA